MNNSKLYEAMVRVWLVVDGEPLPTDGGDVRLHRMGMIAETLSAKKHDVVWWTTTWDHYKKKTREGFDLEVALNPNCVLKMIHSCGYKKNISFQRIKNGAV